MHRPAWSKLGQRQTIFVPWSTVSFDGRKKSSPMWIVRGVRSARRCGARRPGRRYTSSGVTPALRRVRVAVPALQGVLADPAEHRVAVVLLNALEPEKPQPAKRAGSAGNVDFTPLLPEKQLLCPLPS